jgi:signal transduction histidine kinase
VIDNLLHNAIEQSPPRGTVRIGWVVANGQVTVEVSDEGPGIDEGEVEQIFEPFVSSSDHGADGEHVGLGLSFCRAVAHAYGGDVLGRNGERGGAVFTFSIPVPTTDSAEAQEAERLEVAS